MVNTRRSESIGSRPESDSRHSPTKAAVAESADSSSATADEESQSENASCDSDTLKPKSAGTAIARELRSRYSSHSQRQFSSSHIRRAMDDSHSHYLRLRTMHNYGSRYNGQGSSEEMYTRASRRSRHPRSALDRMERRTALSLRPISQKCYADSLSDTEVRRSTRQRKVQFTNQSWLADDQMHKVGYPSLMSTYSDDDDGPDGDEPNKKRREIKNPKYLYDYETNEVSPRRRHIPKRTTRDSNEDKENDAKKTEDESNSNDSTKVIQENGVSTNQTDDGGASKKEADPGEVKEGTSESSDVLPRRRPPPQQFSSRRRAKPRRPFVDSSSSESERKGYSLRNRAPKPMEISPAMKTSALRSRKRLTCHRNASPSSSSESSDSEGRRTKPPRSPHGKNEKMKSGAGGSSNIIPIGPEILDGKVRFSSIGGLDSHIQCLKEMVLLPMMYPEVFHQFQIQPPRGVLFHGPPGTGKTLIARALANECSFGCRKVSFFMRKGADLLSKWIGESEKQLRLLFEQASEMHPSIIFFDELDGLAPVRSSRQDQVHASIVSTLLALMDGLDNRGEVIVIGATNRIDAIDPALRRPGRFDRELFFPLPAKVERESILKVHVAQWVAPPSTELLSYLADTSVGYCGSDLRALCSEAVIQGFRRTYPQVYSADHRLVLDPENVKVEKIDFMRAKSLLVPASHRVTQGLGRKMLPILEPLLGAAVKDVFAMLEMTFPHANNVALSKVKLSPNLRPAQLLILGEGPDCGQTHLAPAVLYNMEHIHAYVLDLAALHRETGRSPEETCLQVFTEARRNVPSVIYIPNIDSWWTLVNETVKAILDAQLAQLDPNIPILLLATADTTYDNLHDDIQGIFSRYRKEVVQVESPGAAQREAFFRPLLLDACLKSPRLWRRRPATPPLLPRAQTPLPTPLTEAQAKKLYDTEEHTLRELRIFLRDICKKLANNKLFYMFTKPVDTEEVPDYPNIIEQPMDLETMMTKVDFHRYNCAKDFLIDIELICHNALEYNPAKTSADKQIRHRACSLRDYAYTLIKNEMDSDFEDKCQDIALKRTQRKASVQKYLPAYIQTPETKDAAATVPPPAGDPSTPLAEPKSEDKAAEGSAPKTNSSMRKRKCSNWQRGMVRKRKKLRPSGGGAEDKKSSEEELKVCPIDSIDESNTIFVLDEALLNASRPLSIECEDDSIKVDVSVTSPRRRLSDLLSPSELLEKPLDFDDIDQALNEDGEDDLSLKPVHCSKEELLKVLQQTVEATAQCSLHSLLDLYNQLNRIVKKYSNTHSRAELPKELLMEVTRFKNETSPETISEGSPASNHS